MNFCFVLDLKICFHTGTFGHNFEKHSFVRSLAVDVLFHIKYSTENGEFARNSSETASTHFQTSSPCPVHSSLYLPVVWPFRLALMVVAAAVHRRIRHVRCSICLVRVIWPAHYYWPFVERLFRIVVHEMKQENVWLKLNEKWHWKMMVKMMPTQIIKICDTYSQRIWLKCILLINAFLFQCVFTQTHSKTLSFLWVRVIFVYEKSD